MDWRTAIVSGMSERLAVAPGRQRPPAPRGARLHPGPDGEAVAGIPRATWGHLESGAGNPTLSVLHKVALALQVPLEELTSAPRAVSRHYPQAALATHQQGDGVIRKLLPDAIPGVVIDRMEIPRRRPHPRRAPHAGHARVPHLRVGRDPARGGRASSRGCRPGDVVVFRGDQRHSYRNPGRSAAVGYSVVLLAPGV